MTRVIRYIFNDILQTRFILIYTIFLLISSFALFQLDNDFGKVVLSLLNIVLMVVPLVSVVFTTIHFFSSYEFIELMLAQPINRRVIFLSEYIAVASSLCMSFLIGVGVPFIMFGAGQQVVSLLFTGIFLTLVFVSLAFLSSWAPDRWLDESGDLSASLSPCGTCGNSHFMGVIDWRPGL